VGKYVPLHEQARRSFDEKAGALLDGLTPLPAPRPRPSGKPPGSMGEYEIAGHFVVGENATLTGPVTALDGYGELTAVEIHSESLHEVLTGEPLERLKALATQVAQRAEVRFVACRSYVEKQLVKWVERTRLGQTSMSWCDEFETALGRDVCPLQVFVPCDGLQIARHFRLGNVEFRFFTRANIMTMTEPCDPTNADDVRYRQRMTDDYLGRVYAAYECTAEEGFAQAQAIVEAEAALDVLRFLDAAAMDIRVRCFIGRYGQVPPGTLRVFIVRPDDNVPRLTERSERGATWRTMITEEFLDSIAVELMTSATRILAKDSRTELEELAIDAVRRYAHGVGSPAVQDRLLHAFTAVESLLLANESEAIIGRLGLRMAFVNRANVQDRRQFIDDLKAGYDLRSRFIHHGRIPTNVEHVNGALNACWRTVFLILLRTDTYETKTEMLRALDDQILA
jgi:hypothetical protein